MKPPAGPPLGADHEDIDRQRHQHHREAGRRHARRAAGTHPRERGLRHLNHHDHQEERDDGGCQRFVFAMAVRMVGVRRLVRHAHAHERGDVRRRVGQRMETVGEDADGAAGIAEAHLANGDEKIEEQDPNENDPDFAVSSLVGHCRLLIADSWIAFNLHSAITNLQCMWLRTPWRWEPATSGSALSR